MTDSDELKTMEEYGIEFDGEKYKFEEYTYSNLKDAVNYATIQLKKEKPTDKPTKSIFKTSKPERNSQINNIPFITSELFVSNKTIKTLGTARGATVRAKHIGRDFMADIKNIVGGELKGYTELLAEGREEAIYRMREDATKMGANAIVSVRFSTSTLAAGAAEILAYGTAVVIEKE